MDPKVVGVPIVCLTVCFVFDSDVSLQKLASLQKVLESDFFNAVREVYERVYETVDITGSPDIRASATAKANRRWYATDSPF